MNFNAIASLFALFASVVFASYSNQTFVPTTVTLEPVNSVQTETTTLTYEDATVTFYITSTLYSTYWYTPVTTASVETIVTDIPTTYESSGDLHTSTFTSTITSTLQITETITSSAATEETSSAENCAPVTQYITVGIVTETPEPVTQYVTVTANATTQTWGNVTVSA